MGLFDKLPNPFSKSKTQPVSQEEQQRLNAENQRRKEQYEKNEKDTQKFRKILTAEYLARIKTTTLRNRDQNGKVSSEEVVVPTHIAEAFITNHQGHYAVVNGEIISGRCIIDSGKFAKNEQDIYLSLSRGTSNNLINEILLEIKEEMKKE